MAGTVKTAPKSNRTRETKRGIFPVRVETGSRFRRDYTQLFSGPRSLKTGGHGIIHTGSRLLTHTAPAMKPSQALNRHRAEIRSIVASHRACNARVFGSILSGEDTDTSDLDLLVDPTPETTLMDIARIQNRLQKLLGISVDVLTPRALPERFRARVLSEAKRV